MPPRIKALMAAGSPRCCRHASHWLGQSAGARSGYTVHRGMAYGPDPRQKLDVYVPQGLKAPAPVLLFFYGGGWQAGNRGDYLAFGQAFASAGIVTVVADYRLYPAGEISRPLSRMRPARWPGCMPMPATMAAIRRAFSSAAIRRAPITR